MFSCWRFSSVRRGSGGEDAGSTPKPTGVSGTREEEWWLGGLDGIAKSGLSSSIALLSCMWLLLPPSLPSEELAESRLSSGESCLAPAGGPEGVGCVAWLLFIIDAAALFAIILLYFDGVSMMGESGEIGTQFWFSRCRRSWPKQRHCWLVGCGGC